METETGNDQPTCSLAEQLDRDTLAPSSRSAASRCRHARYTHQLSEEDTEAVSRWLVRVVPLVFGAMLGVFAAIGLGRFALGMLFPDQEGQLDIHTIFGVNK